MTSWIQNHILLELTRHATRRYTQLRPKDVEGNLFIYHLHGLMAEGMVEKTDKMYHLSAKGKHFAATLSLETGRTRHQPKIVTAVRCINDKGEYLFVRWHRQPNIGLVSLPYGLVHFGETAKDMAALELAEKAGLVGELSHRGDIYVRRHKDDTIDAHMLIHLFDATHVTPGRQDELRPDVCESFWAPLATISREQFVPGFNEVLELACQPSMPGLSEMLIDLDTTKPDAVA